MAALDAADPDWVRRIHLDQMEALFYHRWFRTSASEFAVMFSALERLPEAEEWIQRNRDKLSKLERVINAHGRDDEKEAQAQAAKKLADILQRLGVDPADWDQPAGNP